SSRRLPETRTHGHGTGYAHDGLGLVSRFRSRTAAGFTREEIAMKKNALVSTLLVLSLALVALATHGAFAQTNKPQSTVTGTIVKMTSDDLVLQTDQGELKFDFNKETVKPDNMAVGNKVTISYDSDDTGKHEMDARTIQMYTEPTPA